MVRLEKIGMPKHAYYRIILSFMMLAVLPLSLPLLVNVLEVCLSYDLLLYDEGHEEEIERSLVTLLS
ncbi:uncharacterized protein RHIMIDRAFT_137596 [Rhizopus microsporus ATCC 52813]|uniref:Uncharacterized protein n=1 Tax=Rhizopus microsporus ATCC 52813 TaxID=1340429 RepID=A0A2G4SVM0_RHIZD|nr:uncharacterized protein RHIMIDRAFT_137596 [Rhizopus microsporus ATCC 52813]PHZ12820.1 hypothetical protein RHIMIDRAFT_137596 [Rhizopus microsporus ATCC 52813]